MTTFIDHVFVLEIDTIAEMPTVPFLCAVFSTFFKLQILVILNKMPQNTYFFQGSLCVHFYGKENAVFQAKILFSSSESQNYFFLSLEVGISAIVLLPCVVHHLSL